jgi:hypothetical protein
MRYLLIASLLYALPFPGVLASYRQTEAGAPVRQQTITVTTNEGRALKSLRALLTAETTYQSKMGSGEYGQLNELHKAGLIDSEMAAGLKGGYRFTVVLKKSTLSTPPSVDLIARPSEYGKTARRSFYLTESGVLLSSEVKDAPLSEMRPFAGGPGGTTPNPSPSRDTPPDDTSGEVDPAGDVNANETAIQATLRAIVSAESTFKAKAGGGNYGTLEQLVKQGLIDGARAQSTQAGYVLQITVQAAKPEKQATFTVSAIPEIYGISGRRSFFIDHTGNLRGADKEGGSADATDPVIN